MQSRSFRLEASPPPSSPARPAGLRVVRSLVDVPACLKGAVVVIGNFDGVHMGHAAVIRAARRQERPLAVLTFEPHPRSVFRPHEPAFRLASFGGKARQFGALGVDMCVALDFDHRLASMNPARFVREVLADGLGATEVVVGYDFSFGKDRSGDTSVLHKLGRLHGFSVTRASAVVDADGLPYSSTRIREYLLNGNPRRAAELLGRPWTIEGALTAVHEPVAGPRVAAATLSAVDYLQPAAGRYSVHVVAANGYRCGAIASVAARANEDQSWLRLHLNERARDLLGRHVTVELLDFIGA